MFEDYGDDPTHLDFGKELISRQAEKSKVMFPNVGGITPVRFIHPTSRILSLVISPCSDGRFQMLWSK